MVYAEKEDKNEQGDWGKDKKQKKGAWNFLGKTGRDIRCYISTGAKI